VLGGLMGYQQGRDIKIMNSFEFKYELDNSQEISSIDFVHFA